MSTEVDRESTEDFVAALVSDHGNGRPEVMRATLGILASLLRLDRLPKSGREFLAGIADKIARGEDPRSILPKEHYRAEGKRPLKVLVAVEVAKAKRGIRRADTELYESVGSMLGLTPGSVKTRASIARSHVRKVLLWNLAKGVDRDGLIKLTAAAIRLPVSAVKALLGD